MVTPLVVDLFGILHKVFCLNFLIFLLYVQLKEPLWAQSVNKITVDEISSSCNGYFFEPRKGPLAKVNCDFHQAYDEKIISLKKTFGIAGGIPVIINLNNLLIFKFNGKEIKASIIPASYHDLKAFSHVFFTLFLTLKAEKNGPLSKYTLHKLKDIKLHLQEASLNIPVLMLDSEKVRLLNKITKSVNDFIEQLIKQNIYTHQQLVLFSLEIKPLIISSLMLASKLELDALDNVVTQWLKTVPLAAQKKLAVIIVTSHQPRAEEITKQYFAKKFGFRYGDGAMYEKNFIVLEEKSTLDSALTALARHYLDRESAQFFFSDPERLQRDLLADAAKNHLG